MFGFRSLIRFGSTTVPEDGLKRLEVNSVKGIKTSANKLLMKQAFERAGVKTAQWWESFHGTNSSKLNELPFPIVAKGHYGSRGNANYLLKTVSELQNFINRNQSGYIFEKYYNYVREYRLHVTKNGCFYTCRKMLKEGTPKDKAWQRHDDNCAWFLETNPQFDKPVNWNKIVADCVAAINEVGLDIGCFDIRVQSAKDDRGKNRKDPDYILIECNSAPSFGDVGSIVGTAYMKQLSSLIPQLARERGFIKQF